MQDIFDPHATHQAIRQALEKIHGQIIAVVEYMAEIDAALEVLDEAGMYPAVPSREAWEPRGDSPPVYVNLYWRQKKRGGGFAGPEGKRKLYIGCKPERIAEARRLAENRRRWEALMETRDQLEEWLRSFGNGVTALLDDAQSLSQASNSYPQQDLSRFVPADPAPFLEGATEDVAEREKKRKKKRRKRA
jgi:hypothetical protein